MELVQIYFNCLKENNYYYQYQFLCIFLLFLNFPLLDLDLHIEL